MKLNDNKQSNMAMLTNHEVKKKIIIKLAEFMNIKYIST